ncbi:M23 family metallopeptidase [Desulfovibrio litoralis]|uniref:Peptidase family M23 n=1 Tax=Desulfovibrio litoralis DSM 11393 TaxID=1121455 RepID=A0A1M7TN26_9BACT|nr:M23 family metallopeptidase [Desulfovibrio litoralis]SHN72144.1 Peptidase family M23 [Desulfovibrio litoralis DSM 11393]
MFFKKYHIVIFKDRDGNHRHLRLRGWFGVFLVLLFIAMSGVNIYLFKFYHANQTLNAELDNAQKTIEEQERQLVSLNSKIRLVYDDIARVQQFDSKLRVMLNIDKDPIEINEPGTDNNNSPTNMNFLQLHRQELMTRKMHLFLNLLNNDIRLEEVKQQELVKILRNNKELLVSTPSIWPAEGTLTSGFGMRGSPFTGTQTMHKGLDISNRPGTPIYAPAKGTVTFSQYDGAYGNTLIIDHGNSLSTRYSHMLRAAAKEGQTVQRGEVIGYIGNSGRSTGPHLHYEVRIGGVPVNPMRYILN